MNLRIFIAAFRAFSPAVKLRFTAIFSAIKTDRLVKELAKEAGSKIPIASSLGA